jgi:hypothetical protein
MVAWTEMLLAMTLSGMRWVTLKGRTKSGLSKELRMVDASVMTT